jgi:GNAT superfamily N-acetyltransferase
MPHLKAIWRAVRHGLVLQRLIQRLANNLGIFVEPYYWIQEPVVDMPQGMESRFEGYSFSSFGSEEIKTITAQLERSEAWEALMLERLKEGELCLGLKYHGKIATFMWCNLVECSFEWQRRRLDDNEAYLCGMHTLEAFRGKGLAPYLRYKTYPVLKEMGRDKLYSGSDRFNAPAVRFKQKMGVKFLWLGVGIKLFGKVRRHYIIRRYNADS